MQKSTSGGAQEEEHNLKHQSVVNCSTTRCNGMAGVSYNCKSSGKTRSSNEHPEEHQWSSLTRRRVIGAAGFNDDFHMFPEIHNHHAQKEARFGTQEQDVSYACTQKALQLSTRSRDLPVCVAMQPPGPSRGTDCFRIGIAMQRLGTSPGTDCHCLSSDENRTEADYETMTDQELRARCHDKKLKQRGCKADLITRGAPFKHPAPIRLTNCQTHQGIQIKLTNRQNIQIKLTNHQNFQIKRLM